jgi:hypothetical protein
MNSAVKDRPILFSSAMVRAILDDRKTQTRRVLKLQPMHGSSTTIRPHHCLDGAFLVEHWQRQERSFGNFGRCENITCPYGALGDRLWVRETWATTDSAGGPVVAYRAGGSMVHGASGDRRNGTWQDFVFSGEVGEVYPPEIWKPSIFMPRWASRITLEVTDVRVERLQEISEGDAVAEGVQPWRLNESEIADIQISDESPEMKQLAKALGPGGFTARAEFQMLWDSINFKRKGGIYSWSKNPWVWCISFRRIHGTQDHELLVGDSQQADSTVPTYNPQAPHEIK